MPRKLLYWEILPIWKVTKVADVFSRGADFLIRRADRVLSAQVLEMTVRKLGQ